jgi:hypothetical protein
MTVHYWNMTMYADYEVTKMYFSVASRIIYFTHNFLIPFNKIFQYHHKL